ncbi:MAG TPA: DUF6491 family protein [Rhizomicrobium sp.]|nr:DUF6491 family protein [Rhizomicrobium sp.]
MRKWLLTAALIAAATPAFAADPCIRHDDIRNWVPLNDRTIVVENHWHQKAMLKLIGTCSDLGYHESLAIRSHTAGFGIACIERGDMITTRNSGLHGTCAIVSISPYSGSMNLHDRDTGDHHHIGY